MDDCDQMMTIINMNVHRLIVVAVPEHVLSSVQCGHTNLTSFFSSLLLK